MTLLQRKTIKAGHIDGVGLFRAASEVCHGAVIPYRPYLNIMLNEFTSAYHEHYLSGKAAKKISGTGITVSSRGRSTAVRKLAVETRGGMLPPPCR